MRITEVDEILTTNTQFSRLFHTRKQFFSFYSRKRQSHFSFQWLIIVSRRCFVSAYDGVNFFFVDVCTSDQNKNIIFLFYSNETISNADLLKASGWNNLIIIHEASSHDARN